MAFKPNYLFERGERDPATASQKDNKLK